jgi:NADH:ubiquinone oxidoreductase subunit 2 (subunit N)
MNAVIQSCLAGFSGVVYVFAEAVAGAPQWGMHWLLLVAAGAGAMSFYYYLQVPKQIIVPNSSVFPI